MIDLESLLGGTDAPVDSGCGCEPSHADGRVVIDANDCRHGGDLAASPACRNRLIGALDRASIEAITVRSTGRELTYRDRTPALFAAASTFADAVEPVDSRLAATARRDPLAAAVEATGRAGTVATLADTSGLGEHADSDLGYEAILDPTVGLSWSHWRIDPTPPAGGRLDRVRELDTGATVRIYSPGESGTRIYHLEPVTRGLDDRTTERLAAAHDVLAAVGRSRPVDGPRRAVRTVAEDGDPVATLARVLRKHTRECGLLRDCFADPDLSDAYVTAPATTNPLRVRVDGETLETNVYLKADGVAALASRFRRESGRGFSRATPTLDAATTLGDRRVRVAGVTEPVSDGEAFAFRAHDRDVWTLPALVANDTLTPDAAALFSVAAERGAAVLLAGPRGSGKTTMLGALLWELPPAVRTVCIEDAPELPIDALQRAGRDVQGLRADGDGPLDPAEALRSALRLGDGALVVGEVRGEEAAVLYEAMRVGASSEAVLGTIHGDGAASVLERVVSDLGVPASSFATTDLVVTLETAGTGAAARRRVRTVEEVHGTDPVAFSPLFERGDETLGATGRIDRGNSHLLADLTPPESTYAATRRAIERRAESLATLADRGETDPSAVTAARADRAR